MKKEFYTTAEAAEYLTRHSEDKITKNDVVLLAKEERISVCFECEADLLPATLWRPDGTSIVAEVAIPFSGIAKSLGPPGNDGGLEAFSVQVIRSYAKIIRFRDGLKTNSFNIPTDDEMACGYRVTGFVEPTKIPARAWLFHISDLEKVAALRGDSDTPAQAPDEAQEQTAPSGTSEKAAPEVMPDEGKQIDAWIIRAREIANDIWLRELNVCKKPSKEGIAPEIARRLWSERMVTRRNKRINDGYVVRFALRNGWTPPMPD